MNVEWGSLVKLATTMHGNFALEVGEGHGIPQSWELCACSRDGNPPWHTHDCPRRAGEDAAYGFSRLGGAP